MDELIIPLVEETDEHPAWSVVIKHCGQHDYQYVLFEHTPDACKTYSWENNLLLPEMYIALRFAIAHMKSIRYSQSLL